MSEEQQKQPVDITCFELVASAVQEGITLVRALETQNVFIGKYFDWPEVSYREDGFPSFSSFALSGPVDYKGAFGVGKDARIQRDEISSFQAVLEYAKSNTRLRSYFGPPSGNSRSDKVFNGLIYGFIEQMIDRYMHVHKDEQFSIEDFREIYLPMEAGVFNEELSLAFAVPILFVKFDFEQLALDGDVLVWRMSDDFQVGRKLTQAYALGVHRLVSDSATHAAVLPGWTMSNDNYWNVSNILSNLSSYPLSTTRNITWLLAALGVCYCPPRRSYVALSRCIAPARCRSTYLVSNNQRCTAPHPRTDHCIGI